jgi:hypothetical protein
MFVPVPPGCACLGGGVRGLTCLGPDVNQRLAIYVMQAIICVHISFGALCVPVPLLGLATVLSHERSRRWCSHTIACDVAITSMWVTSVTK